MKDYEITFASNCYEKDYKYIMNTDWAGKLFLSDDRGAFDYRMMSIGNVNSREKVLEEIKKTGFNKYEIDFYFSDDFAENVYRTYEKCSRSSFVRKVSLWKRLKVLIRDKKWISKSYDGYNYGIGCMCAILRCKTEWLLYCTEDVILSPDLTWIHEAVKIMNENDNFFVANPLWNDDIQNIEKQSEGEIEDFYIGQGFSDQCFLINAKRLKNIAGLYAEKNDVSEKYYPYYGGNCFERRINAYMRNHDLKRLTYKYASYNHDDYIKQFYGEK
jgi:hypothetical protein